MDKTKKDLKVVISMGKSLFYEIITFMAFYKNQR